MALKEKLDKLSIQDLAGNLRALYASSAQRRLLDSVGVCLVLFEDELLNTANGTSRRIDPAGEGTRASKIAAGARELIPRAEEPVPVLLLLPSSSFISTRFSLGISGEQLLKSSLRLQVPTLIPACEQPLLLALSGEAPEGVALWFPQAEADALYDAFRAKGLQLAAISPRALALPGEQDTGNYSVLDEDAEHLTRIELKEGRVRAWLTIHRRDLDEEEFRKQWQEESARLSGNGLILTRDTWAARRELVKARPAYCFFPAGAVNRGKALLARKQKTIGAFAAAAMVVVMILPFLGNWAQIAWLNNRVDHYQELSFEARQSQAAVYDMEEEWGAVAEYPEQDVAEVLLTLNQLIESSLSSFNLDEGVIDISGYSQDPALLVEQLAEQELFYGVGQSRSSSEARNANLGVRFGIRMNLSGVDFPAYEEKYEEREL